MPTLITTVRITRRCADEVSKRHVILTKARISAGRHAGRWSNSRSRSCDPPQRALTPYRHPEGTRLPLRWERGNGCAESCSDHAESALQGRSDITAPLVAAPCPHPLPPLPLRWLTRGGTAGKGQDSWSPVPTLTPNPSPCAQGEGLFAASSGGFLPYLPCQPVRRERGC
jgi:hypothetical protein